MKISGFTFIRNGVVLDFPFEESILSLLPLVDEMIVNVGRGEDDTLARVKKIAHEFPRVRIIENNWDQGLRREGKILAEQTNLALRECKGDWAIYIQGDEVFHEADFPAIREALSRADGNPEAEALLFDYLHFYGDYTVINRNTTAYRREIRAIRTGHNIESYKDAQGFRKRMSDGQLVKLKAIASGARVFHYGWVRPPQVMAKKTKLFDKLFHGDDGGTGDNHTYKHIIGLERYAGSHPAVMKERIKNKNWHLDLLKEPLVFTVKDIRKVLALFWERLTGELPFSYKNYIRIDQE